MVKRRQVPQYLNPFSVMAYSSLTLTMTSGKIWVSMTDTMVGYRGGSVTKVYARVFRHCSSMIDAVRRRFG
jgi:hypothetical protein